MKEDQSDKIIEAYKLLIRFYKSQIRIQSEIAESSRGHNKRLLEILNNRHDITDISVKYDKEHFRILKQGVEVWNKWREENPKVEPTLYNVDLKDADLIKINLKDAKLSGANLGKAKLTGANLRYATLAEANLEEANLEGVNLDNSFLGKANLQKAILNKALLSSAYLCDANFTGAILDEANLLGAVLRNAILSDASLAKTGLFGTHLHGVNFSGADFKETDLRHAVIASTIFANNDLSSVKGLETVQHYGPSTIGVDTIYHSKGNIPEIFLRGAGLSENFITYMASLTGKAFEFYSCFISYSTKDQEFADRLYADLQNKAVRCWFAPEDLKIGEEIRTDIDQLIRKHDKLLLILSDPSIKSQWVQQEVETALGREREQHRTVLFPIRLDDTVMDINTGWPAFIKNTRHIGDFSKWKDHDCYRKALERLLRDLRTESSDERRA